MNRRLPCVADATLDPASLHRFGDRLGARRGTEFLDDLLHSPFDGSFALEDLLGKVFVARTHGDGGEDLQLIWRQAGFTPGMILG